MFPTIVMKWNWEIRCVPCALVWCGWSDARGGRGRGKIVGKYPTSIHFVKLMYRASQKGISYACKHVIYNSALTNDILYTTIDPLNRNIFLSVKSLYKFLSLPYFLLGGLFLEKNDRNHGNNFAVWKDEAQQGLQRKNCSVRVLMCILNKFRDVRVDIQKGQI